MAQTLIKVDYSGEKCNGIYYVTDDNFGGVITEKNAPNGRVHKFVIRQTVTIEGVGKKTSKETITKSGITFYKALQAVIAEREPMRESIRNRLLGITDETAERNANAVITVGELWAEYSLYKTTSTTKRRWRAPYAYTMQSVYKTLVKPYLHDMKAMQVRREHVELCIDKARARGLAPRTEQSIISVLKPMFDWWIIRKELDKNNPAYRLDLREVDNARNIDLSWEEIERLYTILTTYKDERYRQVFLWLITGRRVGETLSLQVAHNTPDGYYTITAENNKARSDMIYRIPDGVTLPLLRGYVHTAPRDRHKPLSQGTLDKAWKNIQELAGLPDIHKHDLRHIITTVLANSNVPSELRSMVVGHTIEGITERYRTDTKAGADLKHKAVEFFLKKVFNKIDRSMLWDEYILRNS